MNHQSISRLFSLSLAAILVAVPLVAPRLALGQLQTAPANQASQVNQPERFLSGESVTVSEPINDDAYVTGGQVMITKDIGQDLIVFGGSLQVTGNTKQDLIAAGGNISVNGSVGDDVRIGGGTIVIAGNVGDELMAAGGTIDIGPDATVSGDAILGGGAITINGNINGNAKIAGGEVIVNGEVKNGAEIRADKITVNGTIQGGATLVAKEIVLGADSAFVGDVRYWNKTGALDIATHVTGGTATFDVTLQPRDGEPSFAASVATIAIALLWALASSALILLLLVIFLRGFFVQVEERAVKNFWKDLGIGIGFLLIVPMAAIILCVTLVGIPIGLMLLAGYIATLYLAEIFASIVIALWWANRRKAKWSKVVLFFVSLGVLIVLNLVQLIPIAGWLATGLVIFAVIGSSVAVKWKILRQYM